MKHIILRISILALIIQASQASAQITTENGWYATNELQDIALIYYGATWRNKGTVEDFKPLVTHTFADGHTDWFFPGFLFLELDYNQVTFCPGFGKRNATRNDWERYLDQQFLANRGLKALDACITMCKNQLGEPPFRHKVVIGIPSPVKDNMDWGEVNGRKLYFNRANDRLIAAKWYIDNFIKRFAQAQIKNIDVEGFYWIDESTKNAGDVIRPVADYIHSIGKRFYWIPYFNAPGRFSWRELGFDIAYLQPGYFFHPGKVDKSRIDEACKLARQNGMGLEFEIDQRHLEKRDQFKGRAAAYLDAFDKNGVFENSAIAYYFSAKTVNMLASSKIQEDIALLDRWASFVAQRNKRHQAKDTTPSSNQDNSIYNRTPPNLKKGNRKLNPEDWHF